MSAHVLARKQVRTIAAWLPAALLLIAALIGATGHSVIPTSSAATTGTVIVNGTANANMSVAVGCAPNLNFTISLGAVSYSGACTVTYGATNDPTQKITLADNDAAAPFQGSIPNTTSDCAALSTTADNAGVHIVGTANNSAIAAGWATTCTAASSVGTNTKFRPVPAAAVDACTSSTTNVTTHSCDFEFAVSEFNSDLAPGTYTGTALFTVVDV